MFTWSRWTMALYLDGNKQGKMKKIRNKWVKQYTMIIIARRRRKFRKQNWRYGRRNNHFGLNANFRGLFYIFFHGPSQFSGYLRDLFSVINHFRGFSGFSGVSGVAGHPEHWHDVGFQVSNLWDALRDLEPFAQFKKHEKHPWMSVIHLV